MDFRDGTRAQSIQIGAILLFGILIIFAAGYQAFAVPNQNAGAEQSHSERVQDQLLTLETGIHDTAATGDRSATDVTLGARYPDRTVFLNPPPPAGTLQTADRGDIVVENVEALNDETRNFIGPGSQPQYPTRALEYRPGYNIYDNAPTTVYESGVLHNRFDDAHVLKSDQHLISGQTISLVSLQGRYRETRPDTIRVAPTPVSAPTRTVAVKAIDETQPLNVSVPMTLPNGTAGEGGTVGELLEDEYADGHVEGWSCRSEGSSCESLTINLNGTQTYRFRVAAVGLGSGVSDPAPAYVTNVDGDQATFPEGGTQRLVVELRDEYNGPVPGETLDAAVTQGPGTVTHNVTTSDDGRAAFLYDAPNIDGGATREVVVYVSMKDEIDPSNCGGTNPHCVRFILYVLNSDGS